MSDLLTPATFEPHVGSGFAIELDDGMVIETRLDSVQRQSPRSHGDRTEPFSLVFVGPRESPLPQATYSLGHAELGRLDIFLVPIGPDPSGQPRYEAVFN
jgi:hypothetical protein